MRRPWEPGTPTASWQWTGAPRRLSSRSAGSLIATAGADGPSYPRRTTTLLRPRGQRNRDWRLPRSRLRGGEIMSFILRIYIIGLMAFVPSQDGRRMAVLMVDARAGYHASDGSVFPSHVPMLVARAASCKG